MVPPPQSQPCLQGSASRSSQEHGSPLRKAEQKPTWGALVPPGSSGLSETLPQGPSADLQSRGPRVVPPTV